jgi:acyl-CoA thioesterase II
MAMSAAAAWRTIQNDQVLGSLNMHFLLGSKPETPFVYKIQRLSSGRRFSARTVTIEQGGKVIASGTLSFVKRNLTSGPAMKHAVSRETKEIVEDVTRDDLVPKSRWGPWMKFQRLMPVPRGMFV